MPDTAPIQSSPAPPRTMVRHAAESGFDGGLRAFFEYRDLGIRDATRGAFGAHVIRAVPGRHTEPKWHAHDLAFQMVYVLKGWVRFEYEDIGEVELRPGDCVHQPPRIRHREVAHSDDLELIEITGPAEFDTASAEPPEGGAATLDRVETTG
jgi:quercetin dioxygenase-like cupin family protein